jgi:hypothetical protein
LNLKAIIVDFEGGKATIFISHIEAVIDDNSGGCVLITASGVRYAFPKQTRDELVETIRQRL